MMYIDDEDIRTIEVTLKYNLITGTVKCLIFRYFDEGFSPREVRYLVGKTLMIDTRKTRRTLSNNIRRYYYDWKMAQVN